MKTSKQSLLAVLFQFVAGTTLLLSNNNNSNMFCMAAGMIHYWKTDELDGTHVSGHNIERVGSGWILKGVGDVDYDATKPANQNYADLIWQDTGGKVEIWFLKKNENTGEAYRHSSKHLETVDLSWRFVGVVDIDLDGTADIVWQHNDGRIHYWKMLNGNIAARVDYLNPRAMNKNPWRLEGVIRLGRPYLVFRNAGGGQVTLWDGKLEGSNGNYVLTGYHAIHYHENVGPEWRLCGGGDIENDDMFDEIIWQQKNNGMVHYWKICSFGDCVISRGDVANPGTSWQCAGAGDVDGDGIDEVVLQHWE